jgi:hypothetical protein
MTGGSAGRPPQSLANLHLTFQGGTRWVERPLRNDAGSAVREAGVPVVAQ